MSSVSATSRASWSRSHPTSVELEDGDGRRILVPNSSLIDGPVTLQAATLSGTPLTGPRRGGPNDPFPEDLLESRDFRRSQPSLLSRAHSGVRPLVLTARSPTDRSPGARNGPRCVIRASLERGPGRARPSLWRCCAMWSCSVSSRHRGRRRRPDHRRAARSARADRRARRLPGRTGPRSGSRQRHLVVIADLADAAAYATYRDHPEHRRVIQELVAPALEHREAVQFASGPAPGAAPG